MIYRDVHTQHHMVKKYGTREDGEYVPFAVEKPIAIVSYLAIAFVLPLLFAFRWIVLTPLSFLSKGLRDFLWERLSSLAIDLNYRRPPRPPHDWFGRFQEFAAGQLGGAVIGMVVIGILPYQVLILWYAMGSTIFLLNSLRTLAAHRYRNPGDRPMDFEDQFLDSVDVPGNLFITAMWAPVGLRYHATHHLFPNLPYHNLGKAYSRLVSELPESSVYLQSTQKNLFSTILQLWRESCEASKKTKATLKKP